MVRFFQFFTFLDSLDFFDSFYSLPLNDYFYEMNKPNRIIFLMGVSAAGKTTVGKALSKSSHIPFYDADDFHPQRNKQKMANGIPLTDEDRLDWLLSLNKLAIEQSAVKGCIIACSALKKSYRATLKNGIKVHIKWIFLDGTFELLKQRLMNRKDHFMPISLLQSQFDILEKPDDAFRVSVDLTPEQINNQILDELSKSEFGLIGLGVMGKSLSRNIASKGFSLSVFNRFVAGKEENIAADFQKQYAELSDVKPFEDLEGFVNSLQCPRKIFLMIPAGKTVDIVVEQLLPFLDSGDVIMDGGNSHYHDTERRIKFLNEKGIHYLGVGVSGGEEGALNGPAIMPGGNREAYDLGGYILESIAAKDVRQQACCGFVGKGGSGHFVKMVHNGIEYAEMQLLAEVYQTFKCGLGLSNDAIAKLLSAWQNTETDNYLLEITIDILQRKEKGKFLLDEVLDKAGNKGTGNWTTVAATELGVPISVLTAALFSRYISAFKEIREDAAKVLSTNKKVNFLLDSETIRKAYQLARWINHHQGIHLLGEASLKYEWDLDLCEITRIWTNGCIIRSKMMEEMSNYLKDGSQLLLNQEVVEIVKQSKESLKELIKNAVQNDLTISCFSEALNYLNAYSQKDSSANLIQAQRDYFGAHLYQRKNDISAKQYHTDWNPNQND